MVRSRGASRGIASVCLFLSSCLIFNEYLMMNNNHYSDNELHLMSYQDLRRLSILLQLPANIKKKYMISMIQAHQKGDGCLKTAIANKIMEERKVKRLNSKKKQSKSCTLSSSVETQQIPTDLSVSTQHEFETRFSYVAHYSSKDEITSGISRIIKQEAEVSRRNRSILQQPRKPTRKLSTVGRTEIMLPRNHSLTTPVRLMPQYERGGFPSPGDYESTSGLPNGKNPFQDLNYNYHLHGEFSNALMPTTSHELYRSEPYWHTREVYSNSLVPILSSLLTPSSVTINSSGYASQYTSTNGIKGPNSFQGVYENYIKSNSLIESQGFQSSVTNSSALIVNNHHVLSDSSSNYNVTRASYLFAKGDVDFEITAAQNEINCQHCQKRDETLMKGTNDGSSYLEYYASRCAEARKSPPPSYSANIRDIPQNSHGYFRAGSKEMSPPVRPYESPAVPCRKGEVVETDAGNKESELPMIDDYESSYTEDEKLWEEQENGLRDLIGKEQGEKEGFVDGFLATQNQGSFLSEVSDASTTFSAERESSDRTSKPNGKEILSQVPNFSRCRYSLGHDKYPDAVSDSDKTTTILPSFLSTFCTNGPYNRAYSVCNNSFTGTTETHLNPIMTCTYVSQFSPHGTSQQAQVNSGGAGVQRQWYYAYPESQVPFSTTSSTYPGWNEYTNEMDNKIISTNNSHNVQVIKCRTHGCHYLYSISNPCD